MSRCSHDGAGSIHIQLVALCWQAATQAIYPIQAFGQSRFGQSAASQRRLHRSHGRLLPGCLVANEDQVATSLQEADGGLADIEAGRDRLHFQVVTDDDASETQFLPENLSNDRVG